MNSAVFFGNSELFLNFSFVLFLAFQTVIAQARQLPPELAQGLRTAPAPSTALLQNQQYLKYKAAQTQALQNKNVTAWADATRTMVDMGDGDALRLMCDVWSSGKAPAGNPASALDVSMLKLDSNKVAANCGAEVVKRVSRKALYAQMLGSAQISPPTQLPAPPNPPAIDKQQELESQNHELAYSEIKALAAKHAREVSAQAARHRPPNWKPVTVLGLTIGEPVQFPPCPPSYRAFGNDKNAWSVMAAVMLNDYKPPQQTCYESKSSSHIVYLEANTMAKYPWMGRGTIDIETKDEQIASMRIVVASTEDHDAAKDALRQKFGEPNIDKTVRWQDSNYYWHETPYVSWSKDGVDVVLDYHFNAQDMRAKGVFGTITITDQAYAKSLKDKKLSTAPL